MCSCLAPFPESSFLVFNVFLRGQHDLYINTKNILDCGLMVIKRGKRAVFFSVFPFFKNQQTRLRTAFIFILSEEQL